MLSSSDRDTVVTPPLSVSADTWQTVHACAVRGGVCDETVRRGIKASDPVNRLPAYRVGNTYRIRSSDFDRWLARTSQPVVLSPAKHEALRKARAARTLKAQTKQAGR
jgi:excisionase family DNA binding protein